MHCTPTLSLAGGDAKPGIEGIKMIYCSVSGAVVAALAVGDVGAVKGQAWQRLYSSVEEDVGCLAMLGAAFHEMERAHVDHWLAARLHHHLLPRHWSALVAKFSNDKAQKIQAIGALRPLIATSAKPLFLFKAITAWAIPRVKGLRRKEPERVTPEIAEDLPQWRRTAMAKAALAAERSAVRRTDQACAEALVLPDSFYDMNTWDLEAAAESTRRRWRQEINDKLDDLVSEALEEVRVILQVEGLLVEKAA